MSKPLNINNNISPVNVATADRTGPSTYESVFARVAFALAGIAMMAITIAVRAEPLVSLASQTTAPASDVVYALASITVVATREPKSSMARVRIGEAAPSAEQSGEANTSAILRVSSAAR
jgi:hypothetical protein